MFDHTMWQVNQERHGELLKVAETQRLIRVKTEKPSHKERLVVRIGNLLVSSGLRLQARYEPVPPESPCS